MAIYNKYERYLKYINGVPLQEFKKGNKIGEGEYDSLYDCIHNFLYKWEVTEETICDNLNLYQKEVKYYSEDLGKTWLSAGTERPGALLEENSKLCGYLYSERWMWTGDYICDGLNKCKVLEKQILTYEYGPWKPADPPEFKYEIFIAGATDCVDNGEPFTIEIDIPSDNLELDLTGKMACLLVHDDLFNEVTSFELRYKIQWELGDSIIDVLELTEFAPISKHLYLNAGKKVIKIWGLIDELILNTTAPFKITNWGTRVTLTTLYNSDYRPSDDSYYFVDANYCRRLTFNGPLSSYPAAKDSLGGCLYLGIHSDALIYPQDLGTMGDNVYRTVSQDNDNNIYIDFENCHNMILPPTFDYVNGSINAINFNYCSSLTKVPILNMGTETYKEYNAGAAIRTEKLGYKMYTFRGAFLGCTSLTDIYFGEFVSLLYASNPFRYNTNITNIRGRLKLDSVIHIYTDLHYNYSAAYSFEGCTGLTNLSELILDVNDPGIFKDCVNLSVLPNIINSEVTGTNDYSGGNNSRTFENTGVVEVDAGAISILANHDKYSKSNTNYSRMFANCKYLLKVTGSFNTWEGLVDNFTEMFYGCSNLTSIGSLFRDKTYAIGAMDRMFAYCNIKSLPNDLFSYNIKAGTFTAPKMDLMFAHNNELANYPQYEGKPIWKFPLFYNGTIAKTLAFLGCPLIADSVPKEWGGNYGEGEGFINDVTFTFKTTYFNEVLFESRTFLEKYNTNARLILSDNKILVEEPGTYVMSITLSDKTHFTFPNLVDKITYLGEIKYIHNYLNCTYLCSGINLWKNVTVFDNVFKDCTRLVDIDIDILLNARPLQMAFAFTNCKLSETLARLVLRNVNTLTNADSILENSTYTTDLGIFANNRLITTAINACKNMTNLAKFPTLLACGINCRDFTSCFEGCINATGYAPKDDRGVPVYQWDSQHGVSVYINGLKCFRGCVKATDYNEIPLNWK